MISFSYSLEKECWPLQTTKQNFPKSWLIRLNETNKITNICRTGLGQAGPPLVWLSVSQTHSPQHRLFSAYFRNWSSRRGCYCKWQPDTVLTDPLNCPRTKRAERVRFPLNQVDRTKYYSSHATALPVNNAWAAPQRNNHHNVLH